MPSRLASNNFNFLAEEYPLLANLCQAAEYYLYADPPAALYKLRLYGEKLTELLFDIHSIQKPYNDTFHNRINGLKHEGVFPERVASILFTIKQKGNPAIHDNRGTENDGLTALSSAFKLAKWFVSIYGNKDYPGLVDVTFAKPPNLDARHAVHVLEQNLTVLEQELIQYKQQLRKLTAQQDVALKARSSLAARKIELTEAETRAIIDDQIRKAGWEVNTELLNHKSKKTLPQRGKNMAIAEWPCGNGWADYALFIGKDLYGIIEAKKYASDISSDLTQVKRYALEVRPTEAMTLLAGSNKYHAPFLFSTNGRHYIEQLRTKSGIWFLDVREEYNNARPLQGWFSPDGLVQLYEQNVDEANDHLEDNDLNYLQSNSGLNLRDYQITAIQKVEQRVVHEPQVGKALLAMATGTGKTRTIIGLCYRLIKANRFRRILFLVDRRLLAKQAFDHFQDNKVEDLNTFGEIYHVAKIKELIPDADTRLHFATVQSMVKRLYYDETASGLSVDTYDCIIVDEAHRGYLLDKEMDEEELSFKDQDDYVSKYRMVIDFFDAFVIGLTATPALHTVQIFGHPVFSYSYREAVIDGWLIDHDPPIHIKTKLGEEGIIWTRGEKPKAYDEEEGQVIELDALEDELHIEIEGFNKRVITPSFNRTVINELVNHLDPEGDEKTLIFAARDDHADMVVDMLKEAFEALGAAVPDDAIIKLTGRSHRPKELLAKYKNEKYPNIVVTVDLLTTGIDVPSICNLVFLRRVRSRILYEQMMGRATRQCDDIGKEVFRIYDAVKIYDALDGFTNMKPVSVNPSASFTQLADELSHIESESRVIRQVEQLIAKLHRKKQYIQGDRLERFEYLAGGKDPKTFVQWLKCLSHQEAKQGVMAHQPLWKLLDEVRPPRTYQLVSDHIDTFLEAEQSYGVYKNPEDYIQGFARFVQENRNKMDALNIICSRPSALDRKSLKILKLELDQQGYNSRLLNKAWSQAKNEEIAADIIAYIRTLAIGSNLIDHHRRIKQAMDKIRQQKNWNKIQSKWIDRFEKQLLAESVLQVEDLDRSPFKEEGGYQRLDKIFGKQLNEVIHEINEQLYKESA